jgi:eukaryotic-like serine/threonine-protein kinase
MVEGTQHTERPPVALGPFELFEKIGQGGMASVWRGRHRQADVPVAIKVITEATARGQVFRDAFRRDVWALAKLRHPHVVQVFDHGVIDSATESASQGQFEAGSPYLVMELASGGTLRAWTQAPPPWPVLQTTLLALLDALAHTHARGVIHRDIKPDNVLLCTERDLRAGPRLTDFGIAHHAHGDAAKIEGTPGTPRYMAPEQFWTDLRAVGPWTDLYGLGCVAWHLLTMNAPYPDSKTSDLAAAHLGRDLPGFFPAVEVPSGLKDWLHTMLAKDPYRRFTTAADAAMALFTLAEPSVAANPRPPSGPDRDATTLVDAGSVTPVLLLRRGTIDQPVDLGFPHSWQPQEQPRPSPRLASVGLRLFPMRSVPMVGRHAERDQLWEALRWVHEERKPKMVVLEGPVGAGKRKVARWLARRAAELGVASQLTARHEPRGGPGHGLGPAIARYLRLDGLDRKDLYARLEGELRSQGIIDPAEWQALIRLLSPGPAAESIRHPAERQLLVLRFLRRATAHRPLVLRLDDPQWGPDTLGVIRRLFAAKPGIPVLVLATTRARSAVGWGVSTYDRIEVPPLDSAETRQLVDSLLTLEDPLARLVAERSEGVPLFAAQLIDDWIRRDLLVPGQQGFRLRSPTLVTLPDALHGLWVERLKAALGGSAGLAALEIAAVLGSHVDTTEWRRAAGAAGVRLPTDLVESLVEAGLAQVDGGGWHFAHGLLAESLVRQAAEGGRLAAHHQAAAAALHKETLANVVLDAARLHRTAHHTLQAGQGEKAIQPWLKAAGAYFEEGNVAACRECATAVITTAEVLGLADSDPRPARARAVLGRLLRREGHFDEAIALFERNLHEAQQQGWPAARMSAVGSLGHMAAERGHAVLSRMLHRRALALAEQTGDPMRVVDALRALGQLERNAGQAAAASQWLTRAMALCDEHGLTWPRCAVQLEWGKTLVSDGSLNEAERVLVSAITTLERFGAARHLATAANLRGEIARLRGDMPNAAHHYRAALSFYERVGDSTVAIIRLNLALVLLEQDAPQAAIEQALIALTQAEDFGQPILAAHARLALLAASARLEQFGDWHRYFDVAAAELAGSGTYEHDAARCAHWAGRWAAEAGHVVLARAAFELALAQWGPLQGFDAERTRTQAALAALKT